MTRPTKVYSENPGDFTETLEHNLLMCSNILGNNNKFYSLEIQKDKAGRYQLFSHYGRINGDNIKGGVYEVRSYSSSIQAKKDFDSIIKKKKRGKTKKNTDGSTYKEIYKEVDVISSSVGSSNVVSKTSKSNSTKGIDKKLFKEYGKLESNLLSMLEDENIHEITSVTTMTYTSNGLQTPLGPLTFGHLDKARKVLNDISGEVKTLNKNARPSGLTLLNNEYLSLIPRNLGRNIGNDDLIVTGDKVMREYSLLNQMETAIQLSDMKDSNDTKLDLGFHIQLASKEIHDEVKTQVNKTRKHYHLNNYKVKRVYQLENYKERKAFEIYSDSLMSNKASRKSHKLDYAEVDMFHGSRNSNILSILMNGFYVPPQNAPHVTGRMFGNGVYGADSSTKALNYSAGGWGGLANKNKNIFCFVVLFSLGRVYETQSSRKAGVPSGYNSIFAKGGADLKNNEYIVPSTNQTTMKYLVEFE